MSLSNKEFFHLHGTLPNEKIEEILFENEKYINFDPKSAIGVLEEISYPFNAEDFLSKILENLHELNKNVKGKNKQTLSEIIKSLDDIQMCVFSAIDHSSSQISDIIKCLQKLE